MILHFPNVDTLRLALTSGAIPDAVRATATQFGFDADKSLWVQSSAKLTDVAEKELRKFGVQVQRKAKIDLAEQATTWLQMFPLTRDPRAVFNMGDKTPVLFELTRDGQLAEVATEILRLGNDRQSFRWLDNENESKTLLRVVGPPYYSLLRAVDREGQEGAPIAYREIAPRIWMQLGYTHPLAEHLRPPTGQLLLMRPPHQWINVPEAKLRDIYEVIDFQLPDERTNWTDKSLKSQIPVPVKLTRAGAPEAAELWLLREEGIAQLEDLVRSSDNELVARLAFAVGEKDGKRVVVLRVRPSKSAPPVLVLDGLALRTYLRIPNLFVPVGMALYPPLRRDAVIRLLAQDNTIITWLLPHEDMTFTPESLPDNAFRPLSEWIDYVLEHEHEPIKTWIAATQFDFEGFVCKDDPAREKKPKDPSAPKQPKKPDGQKRDHAETQAQNVEGVEKKKTKKTDQFAEEAVKVSPTELETRLRQLEETFAALATPLDDPARQTVWLEMAQLNGSLNHHNDASICWGNAMWEQPRIPIQWPQTWFRLEAKQPIGHTPTISQILRVISAESTHQHVRLVTAYLIWAAAAPTPPSDLGPHLNKIQQYLEKHESYLGVRTLWLAWHAVHQMSGGDVLTLARARDRVLERLYLNGLSADLDLPGFLRFAGMQASHRFRLVRDQVVRLRRHVQDWAKTGQMTVETTHAYIDLIFAFGLARLGETNEAHKLRTEASNKLHCADEIHSWLYEAFEFRIQQALDGKPGIERLPTRLLETLENIEQPDYLKTMDSQAREKVKTDLRLIRYKIDRLRQKSRILEPHEIFDPFRRWHGRYTDDLTRELATLPDILDRVELTNRLQALLTGKQKYKGAQNPEARILATALDLSPRLGQSFGEEVLDRVPAQMAKLKDAEEKAVLLEKSLFLAAHYDRKEDVQRFVAQFHELLQGSKTLPYDKLIPLFSRSFRSLRKFGLREAVAELMKHLEEVVETDPNLQAGSTAALASGNRSKRLCLLLELASGWFFFGEDDKAKKILDEGRDSLFRKELMGVNHGEVACAYLTTLGQAPMEFALARIMEFFRKVEGIHDSWTTWSHYSLSRLNVVEAMILALISDDFTFDREARKRLDDDEFLVRRRIHRDVRDAMSRAGM